MFLQNNRRIAALITVICLALLVFSLIESARSARPWAAGAPHAQASSPTTVPYAPPDA